MSSSTQKIQLPSKLQFLFEPKRVKVAYGGRGGAKSWGFADALLIQGANRKLRILCGREVQKSIKDSVHKLLGDRIVALGLESFYEIYETEIRGMNGTEFTFTGLAAHTVNTIKSFEGCDICWVEEAQNVSKKSWDILIPTIRKESSEIWVSFNPDLDTDETYVRFVENKRPDSIVVKINYDDNPWFPDTLENERLLCMRADPGSYKNIWEGECKSSVDGAIYGDELIRTLEEGRVCNVPYDPMLKVHVIFDLGWNDSMAIILAQRMGSEMRIIEYIEDSHKTLDWYSEELNAKRYNWGALWLPHDGSHKDYKYGKSAQEILEAMGWDVNIIPIAEIEHGIRLVRMAFHRFLFDKSKTVRLIECVKRYRRNIPISSGEPGRPLHDEFSHGADVLRYLASVADQLNNDIAPQAPLNIKRRFVA